MPRRRTGITQRIRDFFQTYPKSSAKECCRVLDIPYKEYGAMCRTVKWEEKRWRERVEGRVKRPPPFPYEMAHRLEWEIEEPVPMPDLLVIGAEAEKRRPGVRDPRPVGAWYVIPNRNNMREYHDEHVTIRIFPKSGTCRILPGHEMTYHELTGYVFDAFFKAGLPIKRSTSLSEILTLHSRTRIFRTGKVTPFKIDHYRESLGITIKADGSHPEHIEVSEDWPSWVRPLLKVNSELARQIGLHLGVMKGIDKSVKGLETAVRDLVKVLKTFKTRHRPRRRKKGK